MRQADPAVHHEGAQGFRRWFVHDREDRDDRRLDRLRVPLHLGDLGLRRGVELAREPGARAAGELKHVPGAALAPGGEGDGEEVVQPAALRHRGPTVVTAHELEVVPVDRRRAHAGPGDVHDDGLLRSFHRFCQAVAEQEPAQVEEREIPLEALGGHRAAGAEVPRAQHEGVDDGILRLERRDDPAVLGDEAEVGLYEAGAVRGAGARRRVEEAPALPRVGADDDDLLAAVAVGGGEGLADAGGASGDHDGLQRVSPCARTGRMR